LRKPWQVHEDSEAERPAMAAERAPVLLEGEGRGYGEKSVRHECFLMRKLFEEKYIHIWLISRARCTVEDVCLFLSCLESGSWEKDNVILRNNSSKKIVQN
jgi:hypothetical protein